MQLGWRLPVPRGSLGKTYAASAGMVVHSSAAVPARRALARAAPPQPRRLRPALPQRDRAGPMGTAAGPRAWRVGPAAVGHARDRLRGPGARRRGALPSATAHGAL